MDKAPVECPQCKKVFRIPLVQKQGVCPHCQSSLIFEVVTLPKRGKTYQYHEEHINREVFTELIDATIHEKSHTSHSPRVQDIAVISTLDPPQQLTRVKRSVDRLLRTRG